MLFLISYYCPCILFILSFLSFFCCLISFLSPLFHILISPPFYILISTPFYILTSTPFYIPTSTPFYILISSPFYILTSTPFYILTSTPFYMLAFPLFYSLVFHPFYIFVFPPLYKLVLPLFHKLIYFFLPIFSYPLHQHHIAVSLSWKYLPLPDLPNVHHFSLIFFLTFISSYFLIYFSFFLAFSHRLAVFYPQYTPIWFVRILLFIGLPSSNPIIDLEQYHWVYSLPSRLCHRCYESKDWRYQHSMIYQTCAAYIIEGC